MYLQINAAKNEILPSWVDLSCPGVKISLDNNFKILDVCFVLAEN